jgi:hypothetical protein
MHRRFARWVGVLGALAVFPAAAAYGGEGAGDPLARLEERLRRQAEELDRLREEVEALRGRRAPAAPPAPAPAAPACAAPDPVAAVPAACTAAVPPVVAAGPHLPAAAPVLREPWAGEATTPAAYPTRALGGTGVAWGGYLSLEYVANSASDSYFDLHRLILAADAAIADRIDFSMEIEIEHGGISDEIEGEIVLEKAEVLFQVCDAIVPRLGWVLVPFGRYNLYHDDPINDFTVRPFTARYLVPTGFGQPGVGVAGAIPFGSGHVFSYDVALTNGYRDDFRADDGVRAARQARDENEGKQVWGRAAARWCTRCLDVLETGVSGTWARYDEENRNDLTGIAFDVLARWGPFEAKGEYVAYDYERDAEDPADAIEGQSALWLEAGWHFFPCAWRSCSGPFVGRTSLFTLAARWQWMDLDDHVDGAAFEDDVTAFSLGLGYRITERSVFRVDHTWFDAESEEDRRELTFSFSTYF